MVSASKLYARLLASGSAMRFSELQRLVTAFGFVLQRTNGSHHIYKHPKAPKRLNLQPEGKDAKRYQIDQFLLIVQEFDLTMDD